MQRWVQDRYGDQDMFDFYAVNVNENRNLVQNYVEAIGLETPVIMVGNDVWGNYRLRGGISPWPVDYIIDGEGVIQYANHEYEPEIIVMTIDRLLDIQDDIPRIITSVDSVDFGETEIGAITNIPVQIRNEGNADLIITECVIEGNFFENDVEADITIAPGESSDIEFSFSPQDSTALGQRSGFAIISSNDPEQNEKIVFLEGTGIEVNSADQSDNGIIPDEFFLSPAYPNPFNSSTTFSFGLPIRTEVELNVFDISGKLVSVVYSGRLDAGFQSLIWKAGDVSAGVYIVRLKAGEFDSQQKLVLSR
ncbi:MAG: T9SS type A sorting domain-containing protein [Calditrichaeota bacterium]|nr:T9SS type A sorting domain-containing protein [Calditrichota bacterium]MBT7787986.1 T9SS type A sorting domain-containing protein [Calditrichota bacterium]